MKLKDIQKFIRLDSCNYLDSYAGYNERFDKDFNNTFKIFFYLVDSASGIWEKNNAQVNNKYPWILDSVIQLNRGLELLNSSLSLMAHNHMPANCYLFRSALNCFWFAHKFIQKDLEWKAYDSNGRLSRFEISDRDLVALMPNDDKSTDIVRTFNGILHSEFSQGWRYSKSNRGASFELSPHDFETDELLDLFSESLTNIRGIMEFARCVIQSTFLDNCPEDLFNARYFKPSNITSLRSTDYRIQSDFIDKTVEIDLSKYF